MADVPEVTVFNIPEVKLSSSSGHRNMPEIGMGTMADPFDETALKEAVLEAIRVGYRHFDTASLYRSEKPLGEALAEALKLGLIASREELFITSKLWCTDAHADLVVPALKNSLRMLQLEYLDLYLIHWPLSAKPGKIGFPVPKEEQLAMNFKSVWAAMEECQRFGLTKSIGLSNFSCKKLRNILSFATISPSVNQVEISPLWQQQRLRELCKAKDVIVTAYSPLGAKGTRWGTDEVMENETLKEIAKAHEKTVAQICLRWAFEQGVTFVVKSFNKERMKENLQIFDWALSKDDYKKLNEIRQHRLMPKLEMVSPHGPFKSPEELWDGEI
ncbi:non-functional NADPH-dependent codeinone reductase 2-like [Herrania umbratica]|uniref:Non-functional NADPH-dependent codeinone reductase 2-like n=1 Tax=Herrania umbratica TaxID=108875 RepID=A0A6J1B1E8_9ROSI|nr:non-functional NADPH-dependent codeinone reductase 2-like [Herrania umbratica]